MLLPRLIFAIVTTFYVCHALILPKKTSGQLILSQLRVNRAISSLSMSTENNSHAKKKIIVLGGDGFCGWPTSLYLSDKGHDVIVVDNLSRRCVNMVASAR